MPVVTSERRVVDGATVAVLTLNRPQQANAITAEMLEALRTQFRALGRDDEVRAIVLTGAGERAFSAGADIPQFVAMPPLAAAALMAQGQEVFRQIEASPQPVIAAINGYAPGGGLELALACDFRVASPQARLGQPEITLANLPGWGGTQRLPRTIGEPMAKELILTGRLVEADEALSLHLVHQICTDGPVLDGALRLAGQLAQYAAPALAGAKRAIHAARDGASESGYLVERQAVALCFTTAVQQAAVHDFVARRQKGGA